MKNTFYYTKIKKFILHLPVILLAVFLCLSFFNFIYYSLYRLPFPYEIDVEEGFNVERTSWLLQGQALYRRLDTYPLIRNPYPPMYCIFCAPFLMILGKKTLIVRIVSLLYSLLTGFLIYKIVSKTEVTPAIEKKSRWNLESILPGLIAAGLFFSYYVIRDFSTLNRPDMAANFFSVFALYIISKSENNKYIIFAAFISFIALFTKQQALPAIIAIFLYLLIKNHEKGLKFFLTFVFFTGVAVIITQVASNYNFLCQIDPRNGHGFYRLDRFKGFIFSYINTNYIPLLLAIYFVFFMPGNKVYKFFFFCCIPFLISLGLSGAIINHYISFFTAMCILVGFFFREAEHFLRNLAAGFLIFFLLVPNNLFSQFDFKRSKNVWTNPWASREVFDKIVSYIRAAPGDVLTEYASFAFLAGKKVLAYPLVLSPSYTTRETNKSQLLADCQAKKFYYIVYKVFMPGVFGPLLYENYYVYEILNDQGGGCNWFILKPRVTHPAEISESVVYLSDLKPISIKQDWGKLGLDESVRGNRLTTGNGIYSKGLGTHANSKIVYSVDGYKEFRAVIGVDGEESGLSPNYASVIFKVYLDDKLVFESPIFYQYMPSQDISIAINNAKIIKLIITDARKGSPDGNLICSDHADWANARFIK